MIVSDVGRTTRRSSSTSVAALRHPRHLRGEAFDVLGFLHQQALGNEEREVGVDVAGRLEAAVEPLLHQLPDRVAVRPDHHAPLDRRVVGQLGAADDVDVPAAEVLGLRRDLGWKIGNVSVDMCLAAVKGRPTDEACRGAPAEKAFVGRGFTPRQDDRQCVSSSVDRRATGNRCESGCRGSPPPQRRPGDEPAHRRDAAHALRRPDRRDGSHGRHWPRPPTASRCATARSSAAPRAQQADGAPHEIANLVRRRDAVRDRHRAATPLGLRRVRKGSRRWRDPAIASAARAPNTSPSSSELLASRLAPCTPVQATSPAANRPETDVRPSRSVSTPPMT